METRLDSPRKLLAPFVLLSGIPLHALGWLGWRVPEQDRALAAQRFREGLENAAGLMTRELERELTAWEALAQLAESRLRQRSFHTMAGASHLQEPGQTGKSG